MTISPRYDLLLCLSWLHIFFTCARCFVGGYHPHECTGRRVEKLPVTSGNVSPEILMISSRMAPLSAFKSTGRLLLYTLLFK